ncbi:MAG: NADH-quinone oxidoreductase subunit J family protein [Longimicrobiales bacterium]
MSELLWYLFASLAIGGAIGMVTRTNLVGALLFLVLTFFSIAAIYVMLGAHFIGAIQVILYAGAIMVLFLFVIMLLNLGHEYRADMRSGAWIVAGFVAAGLVGYALSRVFGGSDQVADRFGQVVEAPQLATNAVAAIALPLFRDHLVAFELTSILLLVAVIGAVVLAKRRV